MNNRCFKLLIVVLFLLAASPAFAADDVLLNPGSGGSTVASDEIAGKHYQRMKLIHGADGVNDGDVSSANPLPVENINPNLAADNSTNSTAKVPVLPCVANASPPSWTEARQVPCSTTLAGDQRVAVTSLPALPAGTNNIGDVDVLTVPTDPFGANADAASATGSISAKLRHLSATGLAGMTSLPTGSNTIGNVNPGTAANWGIYVEDAGETAGGNLMMAGTVRRDTAAASAATTGENATLNTDASGLLWTRTIDPCSSGAKTFLPINISTATTTEITPSLAGASTNYYVCSLVLVTAAANNVALVDDDSDGCGSVTSGMAGGTSAASGFNLAANSGMTFGNGTGAVFKTNGTNRVVCLVTSAATQLSGTMAVVAAP